MQKLKSASSSAAMNCRKAERVVSESTERPAGPALIGADIATEAQGKEEVNWTHVLLEKKEKVLPKKILDRAWKQSSQLTQVVAHSTEPKCETLDYTHSTARSAKYMNA